jgi:hypothetical protein
MFVDSADNRFCAIVCGSQGRVSRQSNVKISGNTGNERDGRNRTFTAVVEPGSPKNRVERVHLGYSGHGAED